MSAIKAGKSGNTMFNKASLGVTVALRRKKFLRTLSNPAYAIMAFWAVDGRYLFIESCMFHKPCSLTPSVCPPLLEMW
jgi:hypothetical protein